MKKALFILFVCLGIFALYPCFGDVYRCVDNEGNIRYSSYPCLENETGKVTIAEEEIPEPTMEKEDIPLPAPAEKKQVLPRTPVKTEPSKSPPPSARNTENLPVHPSPVTASAAGTDHRGMHFHTDMTVREFITCLGSLPAYYLLGFLLFPPFFAFGLNQLVTRPYGDIGPVKYFYSLVLYASAVPGTFAAVLTAYTLFFRRGDLLNVNIFIYYLPIITFIATLVVISRRISLNRVPGVGKLYAFLTILFISFGAALFIQKTYVLIFFRGSIKTLVIAALVCFAILMISFHALFGKK